MSHSDAVADEYLAGHADRQAIGRAYLRENLMFRLTPRAIDGLRTYYREAIALELAAGDPSGPSSSAEDLSHDASRSRARSSTTTTGRGTVYSSQCPRSTPTNTFRPSEAAFDRSATRSCTCTPPSGCGVPMAGHVSDGTSHCERLSRSRGRRRQAWRELELKIRAFIDGLDDTRIRECDLTS